VILFYMNDVDVHDNGGDNGSTCIHTLYRAKESGSRVVNFVPSHFFVDADSDKVRGWLAAACRDDRGAGLFEGGCAAAAVEARLRV
jgi:hypothetical protein